MKLFDREWVEQVNGWPYFLTLATHLNVCLTFTLLSKCLKMLEIVGRRLVVNAWHVFTSYD